MLNYCLSYLVLTWAVAYGFWIAIGRTSLVYANDRKALRALICLVGGLIWPLGALWATAYGTTKVLSCGCDKLFDLVIKLLD
jgi:hypothetical protein